MSDFNPLEDPSKNLWAPARALEAQLLEAPGMSGLEVRKSETLGSDSCHST